MREICTSGSEGGGALIGSPYLYSRRDAGAPSRLPLAGQARADLLDQLLEAHGDALRHHDLLEVIQRGDGGGQAGDGGGDRGQAGGELDGLVGGGVARGAEVGAGFALVGEGEQVDVGHEVAEAHLVAPGEALAVAD